MTRRIVPTCLLFLAAILAGPACPAAAASRISARGAHGMVVSPDSRASEAGLDVLRNQGNAVDAAVATAFALTVTFPVAAPVGGGGFLLLRTDEGHFHALDFREMAPSRLRGELFLDEEGRPIPSRSRTGGLAVGVPGTVAGLAEAHRRWGSRPWKELLQPAIRLAEEGIPVSRVLQTPFAKKVESLAADPETRRIFTDDGRPLPVGHLLVQADLASALRRIARQGPAAFYEGTVAEAIADTVTRHGGVMQTADLTGYRSVLREPVEGRYRGHRIVSFPPPSSGGVALLQILGMLERFDLREATAGSSRATHLIVEAERRAFADRSRWLGDADFFDVPVAGLLARDYLAARASAIDLDHASPSERIAPGRPRGAESEETLHLSVADDSGAAVSMTLTLNGAFGACIVARGTGILLNNEIDDFAMAPGSPNLYGLLGGEANKVEGGKRPLSSMTPTIVERAGGGKRPLLVLGSPGGAKIITSVLQVLVNVIDHEMGLQEAIDHPRFHHQWQPDRIQHEPRAFPADVERALRALGHDLLQSESYLGNVNAIGTDDEGNWLGAADPRREGAARGY